MAYFATNEITGTTTAVALTGNIPLRSPVPISDSQGELMSVKGTIIFASGVNLAINDVIELAVLPANHVLVDWILLNDDFSSAADITIKIGLMTGTPGDAGRLLATVGVELLASGATTLQAAALTRGSVVGTPGAYRLAPSNADVSIGLGVVVAPTNIASVRQLDFIMQYRAQRNGL